MNLSRYPHFFTLDTHPAGRWRLWAFFAAVLMVATIGTWIAGQYQIGRLDSIRKRYNEPVQNYAKMVADCAPHSLERDLLDGCKQAQIGSWLQTTDVLRFDGPLTGNRIDVRLDPSRAYLDLNGKEMAECVQDEIEDRQFDIGSMTGTWTIILLLSSLCMGGWAWLCYSGLRPTPRQRNIYAETLAEAEEKSSPKSEEPAMPVPANSSESQKALIGDLGEEPDNNAGNNLQTDQGNDRG